VRPRRPPPPPEMPARLRAFDPTEWGAEGDSDDELREARSRQTTAWLQWCSEYQVSPLEVLVERRRKRAAEGRVASTQMLEQVSPFRPAPGPPACQTRQTP
jgi:hypothetical protein